MRNRQCFDGGPDPLGRGKCPVVVGARQNDRKFLAPIARGQFTFLRSVFSDCGGDRAEAVVAGLMTVGIVERLEAIDIHDQQGQRVILTKSAAPFLLKGLVEGAPVGNSGQTVLACKYLQLRFENLLLMDITHGEDDVRGPARVRIKNRAAVRLDPDHCAVAPLDAKFKFHLWQISGQMCVDCRRDLRPILVIDEAIFHDIAAHGIDFTEAASVKAFDGRRDVARLAIRTEAENYIAAILGKQL